MIENTIGTAMYLAGHGSKTKPRLIDLQYQRVLRYRRALLRQDAINRAFPVVFTDIRLPAFGMGHVTLNVSIQFGPLSPNQKISNGFVIFHQPSNHLRLIRSLVCENPLQRQADRSR
jgi:hypothetical protein